MCIRIEFDGRLFLIVVVVIIAVLFLFLFSLPLLPLFLLFFASHQLLGLAHILQVIGGEEVIITMHDRKGEEHKSDAKEWDEWGEVTWCAVLGGAAERRQNHCNQNPPTL